MNRKFLFCTVYLSTLLITIAGLSCSGDQVMDYYDPKVVVEGRIENEEYPTVLLSISAPVSSSKDTLNLLDYAIRSATVTVSDGENSEILYLTTNKERIPPYEYKGKVIKGEAGKTYSLSIKYGERLITSSTYIPHPVEVESFYFKKNEKNDTTGNWVVRFKNTADESYQLSTAGINSNSFIPCLYGNIDSKTYTKGEDIEIQISKGPSIYPDSNFNIYFTVTEIVRLKLSVLPKESFTFWENYQNDVLNVSNPIFPVFTSLKSNITGGIGIWSGYGINIYTLNPKEVSQ